MIVEVRGIVALRRLCRGFRHDVCKSGDACPGHVWHLPQYFSASIEDVSIEDVSSIARILLVQKYSHYDSAEWLEIHLLDVSSAVERCEHCALTPCTQSASICLISSRIALCRHCLLLLCCTYSLDRSTAGLVHVNGEVYSDEDIYHWQEATAAPLLLPSQLWGRREKWKIATLT